MGQDLGLMISQFNLVIWLIRVVFTFEKVTVKSQEQCLILGYKYSGNVAEMLNINIKSHK